MFFLELKQRKKERNSRAICYRPSSIVTWSLEKMIRIECWMNILWHCWTAKVQTGIPESLQSHCDQNPAAGMGSGFLFFFHLFHCDRKWKWKLPAALRVLSCRLFWAVPVNGAITVSQRMNKLVSTRHLLLFLPLRDLRLLEQQSHSPAFQEQHWPSASARPRGNDSSGGRDSFAHWFTSLGWCRLQTLSVAVSDHITSHFLRRAADEFQFESGTSELSP